MEWMVVVLMGVSGCGKTTVGLEFTELIRQHKKNCVFLDADDFHPAQNIEKMRNKIPLTDQDRLPWLLRLNQEIKKIAAAETILIGHTDAGLHEKENMFPFVIVLACSALRRAYRERLSEGIEDHFAFAPLKGSFDEIRERLQTRKDHFFNKDLLRSQFDTFEDITTEEAQHYRSVIHLPLSKRLPPDESPHRCLPNELARNLYHQLFTSS